MSKDSNANWRMELVDQPLNTVDFKCDMAMLLGTCAWAEAVEQDQHVRLVNPEILRSNKSLGGPFASTLQRALKQKKPDLAALIKLRLLVIREEYLRRRASIWRSKKALYDKYSLLEAEEEPETKNKPRVLKEPLPKLTSQEMFCNETELDLDIFFVLNEFPVELLEELYDIGVTVSCVINATSEDVYAKLSPDTFSIQYIPEETTMADDIRRILDEISDLKRQHDNYIQHTNVLDVSDGVDDRKMTEYDRILDAVPSECVTVPLIVHALVEECSARMAGRTRSSRHKKRHGGAREQVELLMKRFELPLRVSDHKEPVEIPYGNALGYTSGHCADCADFKRATVDVLRRSPAVRLLKSFERNETNGVMYEYLFDRWSRQFAPADRNCVADCLRAFLFKASGFRPPADVARNKPTRKTDVYVEHYDKPTNLQMLDKMHAEYPRCEYKYYAPDDTLLLAFDGGGSDQTATCTLPTPVNLRDFCAHISEYATWVLRQEEEYWADRERRDAAEMEETDMKSEDFIVAGSIKDGERKPREMPEAKKQTKSKEKCFEAYNVSDEFVQLVVNNIRYRSSDDVSINVDKTSLNDASSIKVTMHESTLVLNCAGRECLTSPEPFTFNLNVRNGIIMTFGRPALVLPELKQTQSTNSSERSSVGQSQGKKFSYVICSSALHKYKYVKRTWRPQDVRKPPRSTHVPVAPRQDHTCRSFPFTERQFGELPAMDYEWRATLPTGLKLSTAMCPRGAFYVKQSYLADRPELAAIRDEDYRCMLRCGVLLKFLRCGDLVAYHSDATARRLCYGSDRRRAAALGARLLRAHTIKRAPSTLPLHAYAKRPTKLQRKITRANERFRRHAIGATYTTRPQRTKRQLPEVLEIAELIVGPDGTETFLKGRYVTQQPKYYQTTHVNGRDMQILTHRQDGTSSLIDTNGAHTVQFPDGTRITSWPVASQDIKMKSGPFVVIDLCYKFEHPYYATVTYTRPDHITNIQMPDDTSVEISPQGTYTTRLPNGDELSADKSTVAFTTVCKQCRGHTRAVIQTQQLYNNAKRPEGELLSLQDESFTLDHNGNARTGEPSGKCRCDKRRSDRYMALKRDLTGCQYFFGQPPTRFTDTMLRFVPYETHAAKSTVYTMPVRKTYTEQLMMLYEDPVLTTADRPRHVAHAREIINDRLPIYVIKRVVRELPIVKIEPELAKIFTAYSHDESFVESVASFVDVCKDVVDDIVDVLKIERPPRVSVPDDIKRARQLLRSLKDPMCLKKLKYIYPNVETRTESDVCIPIPTSGQSLNSTEETVQISVKRSQTSAKRSQTSTKLSQTSTKRSQISTKRSQTSTSATDKPDDYLKTLGDYLSRRSTETDAADPPVERNEQGPPETLTSAPSELSVQFRRTFPSYMLTHRKFDMSSLVNVENNLPQTAVTDTKSESAESTVETNVRDVGVNTCSFASSDESININTSAMYVESNISLDPCECYHCAFDKHETNRHLTAIADKILNALLSHTNGDVVTLTRNKINKTVLKELSPYKFERTDTIPLIRSFEVKMLKKCTRYGARKTFFPECTMPIIIAIIRKEIREKCTSVGLYQNCDLRYMTDVIDIRLQRLKNAASRFEVINDILNVLDETICKHADVDFILECVENRYTKTKPDDSEQIINHMIYFTEKTIFNAMQRRISTRNKCFRSNRTAKYDREDFSRSTGSHLFDDSSLDKSNCNCCLRRR